MPHSKLTFLRRNAAQQSKKRAENYPVFTQECRSAKLTRRKVTFSLCAGMPHCKLTFFAQECRAASQRIASNRFRCSSSTTPPANGLHT
jgi:hypothetical protein